MVQSTPADAQEYRAKVSRLAGRALILGLAILLPLAGWIGWDFEAVYWGQVRAGVLTSRELVSPYPALWLFSVFASLPLTLAALLWYLANAFGYLFALERFKGHTLWFALSIPCIWTFIGGQIEGIMALGLALAVTASPLWAGLGITLLSLKPQLGLFPILFVLLKRRDWRLLVVPAGVYLLSLLRWGFWVDDWLVSAMHLTSQIRPDVISLFPYTLILLPLLIAFRNLPVWVFVESLVMPYFGFYSVAPGLTAASRWAAASVNIGGWLAFWLLYLGPEVLKSLPLYAIVMLIALAAQLWFIARDEQSSEVSPAAQTMPAGTE